MDREFLHLLVHNSPLKNKKKTFIKYIPSSENNNFDVINSPFSFDGQVKIIYIIYLCKLYKPKKNADWSKLNWRIFTYFLVDFSFPKNVKYRN